MPTECERSVTSPSASSTATLATATPTLITTAPASAAEIKDNLTNLNEDTQTNQMMEGDMSTSQTSTTSNGSSCNGGRKTSLTSPDPTAYVAKARVTRPTPPPPPYNPMQFVQIKPCNLYQTAQEQLKKAEEVKKIKEIRKEEPEDWQNNLDNWKSSRRKRVEHIIDRVVEVKKLELEEHDRTRRKSKTFSEMIEERSDRPHGRGLNKLASLAIYAEDEANDLSDLGIGTSSASGKSSLSEDYDNNSVMSDNAAELDKAITNSNHKPLTDSTTREYISSPGYETSSSTAPASSPDPCEYTYEGAIQDYKQRVSRAASGLTSVALNKLTTQQQNSKESTPERGVKETASYPPRRGSKIEDRLMGFEVQSPSEECVEKNTKVDVPKIDISKRKEMFEAQQQQQQQSQNSQASLTGSAASASASNGVPRVTLRDRFKVQDSSETISEQPKKDVKRMSGDITSIKERLQSLEQQQNLVNGANGANGKNTANKLVDIPVPPLKERLSSLQNAATKEEVRKPPVVLIDARQLEIMKSEDQKVKQTMKDNANAMLEEQQKLQKEEQISVTLTKPDDEEEIDVDRDDSGIHTADDIELEERVQADLMKKEQELKLNAAIEALAMEEKQLSEAANAVNQIEAEFEELSLGSVAALPPNTSSSSATATTITNDHMEYSVSSTNNSCLSQPETIPTISNSSNDKNNSSLDTPLVKGNGNNVASSNLRRKPTNEMVHAKNLLKIFKDTFQNDIELDESEVNEEPETKDIREIKSDNPLSLNIKTQNFETTKAPTNPQTESSFELTTESSSSPPALPPRPVNYPTSSSSIVSSETLTTQSPSSVPPAIPPRASTPQTPNSPCLSRRQEFFSQTSHSPSNPTPQTPHSPSLSRRQEFFSQTPHSPSGIPRSMTPSGKPPMSPLAVRSTTKFVSVTPPGSPSLGRKSDSQFSINGRVEIFNSKNMATPSNNSSNINTNIPKPTTPIMTTKKTQLPYINAATTTSSAASTAASNAATSNAATPNTTQANNIVLPLQQHQKNQQHLTKIAATTSQQQQHQPITTVIEPLSPTTTSTATAQQQHIVAMKSMPSPQMVNEPQMLLDGETYQHHIVANLNKDSVKHDQQQQQPEVVMCAPPTTIVNPDELPKPNTVKNLSSCFQQPNAIIHSKAPTPKPLPRSRIPQATPPQSPTAARRHVCYSSSGEHISSTSSGIEEQKNSPMTVSSSQTTSGSFNSEEQKKLSSNSQQSSFPSSAEEQMKLSATSSNSEQSSSPPSVEERKKLFVTSSNSQQSSSSLSVEDHRNSPMTSSNSQESSSPLTVEERKKLLSTSSNSQQSSSPSSVEEQKNLSMISTSSNSSTSTGSTVIDANKKLSIMSNTSSTSSEIPPTFGKTNAQVHKVPEIEEVDKALASLKEISEKSEPMPAKTLDKEATQALIDEMIKAEALSRAPPKPKVVTPKQDPNIKTSSAPHTDSSREVLINHGYSSPTSPTSPKANFLKFGEIKPYEGSSPTTPPPNTPSSPLMSAKSDLFKNTKPLVVSTLYDKYLPDPLPPNNQRPTQISTKTQSKAKEITSPPIIIPADLPPLIECPPNDSSLYKLASSAPHSPSSPCSNPDLKLDIDSAICNSLLTSLAVAPDVFQRQTTIEEDLCQKVDKETLPFNEPITGFKEISKTDIKRCDGLLPSSAHKLQSSTQRQRTVEEELCEKLDITTLPDGKQQPITGFKSISPTEIKKCDNFFATNAAKPNSKPSSPIMQARAAHSKALIETCEKIIAEEKQASSQMKSSLPSSPRQTPQMQRKSKIPKPISSCCKGVESLNEADFKDSIPQAINTSSAPTTSIKEDSNAVIARMHVVETQIKVTTTTPPASPKVALKPQPSPKPTKKTKNIFDFLKKNFGVGGSNNEETTQEPADSGNSVKPEVTTPSENKVIVLSAEDVEELNEVKYDEIHKIENSKFYLNSNSQPGAEVPPPLPKTPAPVNIEITRKIITDEILEGGKTEMDLSREIDDLLDDELNKLNHEVEELDKLGKQ